MTLIQPPRVQWVVNLLQLKLGYVCDIFTPRVQYQETNTYHMIIGILLRSTWRIRNNHKL
jgi:hypothetical protein